MPLVAMAARRTWKVWMVRPLKGLSTFTGRVIPSLPPIARSPAQLIAKPR